MKTLSREFFPGWFAAFCLLPFLLTSCGEGSSSGSSPQSVVTTATTPAPTPGISLLAGKLGGSGNGDGVGQEARFSGPAGVVIDSAGNVYVADSGNNVIRKIASDGTVTTFAGKAGEAGTDDGTTAARFNSPYGLAVDSGDNIYVADTNNHAIRKITPAGTVSTLAGTIGKAGSVDANGTSASFNRPYGIAFDVSGNLLVADGGNAAIRTIAPNGDVTTLAGGPDSTTFAFPAAVTVASNGSIFVSDALKSTIYKVTAGGTVTVWAGTPGTAGSSDVAGSVTFNTPTGLQLDASNNLYVADSGNHVIRRISPDGSTVSTPFGSAGEAGLDDGASGIARFSSPFGLTMDASGNLLVGDYGNDAVRKIAAAGAVMTLAGMGSSTGTVDAVAENARFNQPSSVAVDSSGNVYVADALNSTIRAVATNGAVTTWAGSAGTAGTADGTGSAARFGVPSGVAVSPSGTVYVVDGLAHSVRAISPDRVVTTLAGLGGLSGTADGTGSAARFLYPQAVATDLTGNLYVADTGNSTIRKISSAGVVTTLAGSAGVAGYVDSPDITKARFRNPAGIAIGNDGVIYVADTGNNVIRKIDLNGAVETLAGSVDGAAGSDDGVGPAARFNGPGHIAVDADNNVYVVDTGNHTIRRVDDTGQVTTLAGVAGESGVVTGGLPGRLNSPVGVAIGVNGELYTTSENGVLKVTLDQPISTFGIGINATPATFYLGNKTTLAWSLRQAENCTASVESGGGDWSGSVDNSSPQGTKDVTPTASGTYHYTLSCDEANGTRNASSSVTVTVKELPPSLSFSATATYIAPGGATTLNWSSSNATSCSTSGEWSDSVATSGSKSLTGLTEGSHSYTLTCTGPGGAISRTVNILAANPPTLTLTASSLSVNKGQSLTLSWTGSNVTSCTANGGWSGGKSVTGSEAVTPSASGSVAYAMTCSGTGGNVTKVVTVTVGGTGSGGGSNDGGGSGGGGASGLDLLLGLGGLALLRRRLRKHPGVAA